MNLLRLQGVNASYGTAQALFGVDLSVDEGEVVALMGRNGMGKSTTIKVICRLLINQSGSVHFANRDLRKMPAFRVARLGVGLVPEGRRCFTSLTVLENLIASARAGEWNVDKVTNLFPRLGERSNQLAGSLSGGEQQMLAIGRALMTNPKILILDEATEGLAPVVRQEIWRVIGKLKQDTGLSILIVDKSIKELSRVADRGVILERGKSVWEDDFKLLSAAVTDQYLGV